MTLVETAKQDPLKQTVRVLNEVRGVWPESFQYANDVTAKVTNIVTLLQPQSGDLELPADVANVSRSMPRLGDFRFPNGDLVRFGGDLGDYGLTYTDTTSPTLAFDTVGLGWAANILAAEGVVTIERLHVAIRGGQPPASDGAAGTLWRFRQAARSSHDSVSNQNKPQKHKSECRAPFILTRSPDSICHAA